MVLIGLAAVLFIGINRLENPKSTYATYEDIIAAGAIKRGWVPEFIPQSATNIVEQHNIDTNDGFLSFNAPELELEALKSKCKPLTYNDVKYLSNYPLWWPSELEGSNEVSSKLDFYLCAPYGVLTTLSPSKSYYWYVGKVG